MMGIIHWEAFAFAGVSIAHIWVRPLWWSWSLQIPLALVVVSFVWHSETAESLGFSRRAAAPALLKHGLSNGCATVWGVGNRFHAVV